MCERSFREKDRVFEKRVLICEIFVQRLYSVVYREGGIFCVGIPRLPSAIENITNFVVINICEVV